MARLKNGVWRALSRGGWRSRWELVTERYSAAAELRDLLAQGKVFRAQVPVLSVDEGLRFYHLLTPGLRMTLGLREATQVVDAVSLPSRLLASLARRLRRGGSGSEDPYNLIADPRAQRRLAQMLSGAAPVTRHLEQNGLFSVHPRPGAGFAYPCRWRVYRTPRTTSHRFIYAIDFRGTIKQSMVRQLARGISSMPSIIYRSDHRGCSVAADRAVATITLYDAAYATVDRRNLQLTRAPSPRNMLLDTAERICECAQSTQELTPFVPFMQEPFRLLHSAPAENGRGEKVCP